MELVRCHFPSVQVYDPEAEIPDESEQLTVALCALTWTEAHLTQAFADGETACVRIYDA